MKKIINSRLRKIINVILFSLMIGFVFLALTYLFRGDWQRRYAVNGLKEEERDSIDVIYIGGSAAYEFFQPLQAFEEYGITAYDLATSQISAEAILPYIKYSRKYQKPTLYIIGVRAFEYFDVDNSSDYELRGSADAFNIGMERNALINEYLNNRNLDTDELALYIDLIKYHTNYEPLSRKDTWELIDNSIYLPQKGGHYLTDHHFDNLPTNFVSQKRMPLNAGSSDILINTLEYLKSNDIHALFVVSPYSTITLEDYEQYNSMRDIIEGYGYEFLNTNDYYNEMNLDFETDFSDSNHVNCIGAEKFTRFMCEYIKERYDIEDHRAGEDYSVWKELSSEYVNEVRQARMDLLETIEYEAEGINKKTEINSEKNLDKWASLIKDPRYYYIYIGGAYPLELNEYNKAFLKNLGLTEKDYEKYTISVMTNGEVITVGDSNEYYEEEDKRVLEDSMSGIIASRIRIENSKYNCKVELSNKDFNIDKEDDAPIIMVLDCSKLGEIIDCAKMVIDEKGKICCEKSNSSVLCRNK